MAPAITLKRMYHCVPSSIRTIDAIPNPPPIFTRPISKIGKKAVAGTDAKNLRQWLHDAREPWVQANGYADRNRPQGGDARALR